MKRIFLLLAIFSLFASIGIGISAASLSITTKNLPNGTVGLEYNQQIQSQGGTPPHTFSLKSGTLPPGLSLAPNGAITGRAAKDGALQEYKFSIRVVDGTAQIDDQDFSIFIAVAQLKITNPIGDTVPSGIVGEPYQGFTFGADGGIAPYTFTNPETTGRSNLSDLGLQLSANGKITGTPIKSGSFSFSVRVTGDPVAGFPLNGVFTSFKIEVGSVPFEITTGNLSSGQLNTPYGATLSAHGGTPPYSWSMVSGALPNGLNLSGGTISGTPIKEGNFSFTMLVKDTKGTELAKPFLISIEKSCQCSDGTPCGSCKAGSPPLYCDGTTKTLINNQASCQSSGGQTGGDTPPGGGLTSSGKIPTGKLEVNWPNSPMGTALNDNGKLTDLIKYLYEWGISLGGFAAFIALIIAGFQYLTSAGNAGKMSDAMSRIRSAGLGLVLLFGSFLILNTINPQLTELKMPTLTPGEKAEDLKSVSVETTEEETNCKGATLYSGTYYENPDSSPILLGKTIFSTKREVGSVKLNGNCQLVLYQFSDCTENADSPSAPVSGNTPDVGLNSGGNTLFKCAKLTASSFTIPQPK